MTRIALQLLEITTLAVIAVVTHRYVNRRRGVFLDDLEELAGRSVRMLVGIADVVAGLIYVAFAAAVVPFGGGAAGLPDVESVFDVVAVFALLVAAAQVTSLVVLHRVANHLQPWPPRNASLAAGA